ncbi:MAG: PEP-CTERM sorting domain-containing protein [Chitinophagaceae bacterium]|nr:PEP-CTERM sorting domain-containing protein [Rubrivivax sp.]
MRLRSWMVALASAASLGSAQAVDVLSEGFESVAALAAAGWVFTNTSVAPGEAWFQGNAGIFPAASGSPGSYAAASFLGTTAPTGAISNWLITPTLTLDSTSTVSFSVRNDGAGFLDTLEVRLSSAGASADVANFTSLVGTFSSSTDNGWAIVSYNFASLATPVSGRLAFVHVVSDVAVAGNYIGIDNVLVTAVPEPAGWALLGLGIAGLAIRRRVLA